MKKSFISFVILLSVPLLLFACSFDELDDGYQVGDASRLTARELKELYVSVHQYCDKASSSTVRTAALTIIRLYYPQVPANGICLPRLPENGTLHGEQVSANHYQHNHIRDGPPDPDLAPA